MGPVGPPIWPRPDWWQRGVIYQIYPRSFADTDGDGSGDLAGVLAKLDYVASLGVDAIWLSPIYPSPGYDVGYDVADHRAVDPLFGTLADFDRLVEEAHRRGMGVVLDLVLNHTSHEHPWFVDSRRSRTGDHAGWYVWRDPLGRTRRGRPRPPNNWVSFFGGSAWTWEPARGQFYLHTFLPQQPDLDFREPAVREAQLGVVRHWLDRGVDGFRLDTFNCFFKHPDLTSNPRRRPGGLRAWDRQRHVNDKDQPELVGFLAELRAIVDDVPGRMTVSELFEGSPALAARHVVPRHLVFDFRLLEQRWQAAALADAIDEREAAYGPDRTPTVVLSNHDRPRHAGRFARDVGGDAARDAVAKAAAVLSLTLRGTPFLYYGEEIALGDVRVPRAEIVDPPARRYWPLPLWWNRDQCRSPMPWSGAPGGGFSAGRPWMRLAPDVARRNVADQAADQWSVLSFYRRLIALRRATPALQVGEFGWVARARGGVLAYRRSVPGETVVVAINTRRTETDVSLGVPPSGAGWIPVLSSLAARGGSPVGSGPLRLGPLEAVLLRPSTE